MATHSRFGGPPRFGGGGLQLGGFLPPVLKKLLIANTALFVVYFLARAMEIGPLMWVFRALSLVPNWLLHGAVWQPVTYMFLHSPFEFGHILINMLMLWMFGANIERDLGSRKFIELYLFSGVGAGLCDAAVRTLQGGSLDTPTIGASGAIYGILLAFGLLYPHATVYFWMIFPLPARVFVGIMGGIAFLMTLGSGGGAVSHVAHLSGMIFAYIYLRHRPKFLDKLDIDWLMAYRQWKLRRARKKFEVYMKKRDGGGGGWVQ